MRGRKEGPISIGYRIGFTPPRSWSQEPHRQASTRVGSALKAFWPNNPRCEWSLRSATIDRILTVRAKSQWRVRSSVSQAFSIPRVRQHRRNVETLLLERLVEQLRRPAVCYSHPCKTYVVMYVVTVMYTPALWEIYGRTCNFVSGARETSGHRGDIIDEQ